MAEPGQFDIRIAAAGGDAAAGEVRKVTSAVDEQARAVARAQEAEAKWARSPHNPANAPAAAQVAGSTLPGGEVPDTAGGMAQGMQTMALVAAAFSREIGEAVAQQQRLIVETQRETAEFEKQIELVGKKAKAAKTYEDLEALRREVEVRAGQQREKVNQMAMEEGNYWERVGDNLKTVVNMLHGGVFGEMERSFETKLREAEEHAAHIAANQVALNQRQIDAAQNRRAAEKLAADEAADTAHLTAIAIAENATAQKDAADEARAQMHADEVVENNRRAEEARSLAVLKEKEAAFARMVEYQMQLVAEIRAESAATRAAQMAESKTPIESRAEMERRQGGVRDFQSQAHGLDDFDRPMGKEQFRPRLGDEMKPKLDFGGRTESVSADNEVKRLEETLKSVTKALQEANKAVEKTQQEAVKIAPALDTLTTSFTDQLAALSSKVDGMRTA